MDDLCDRMSNGIGSKYIGSEETPSEETTLLSHDDPVRSKPPAQDDESAMLAKMAQQFTSLSAAMTAQGVFNIVKVFSGELGQFKQWEKDLEKEW